MGVERNSYRIAKVVYKMESKLVLLVFVFAVSISQVASLQCWVCVPPKWKGTQSPPCEFDAHQWGVLETCPEESNVCLTSVQTFEGVQVHVRECGEMKGGINEISDECMSHNTEKTEKTEGSICYCKEDGCNRGLDPHNSATQSKITLALLGPVLLSYYYLAK